MTDESALLADYVARIARLTAERDEARAEVEAAWDALGTTAEEAADDPDTAALADSIRISLQYERDKAQLACEQFDAEHADRERTKAELQALAMELGDVRTAAECLKAERDAARAELASKTKRCESFLAALKEAAAERDAAQAEAAAMRIVATTHRCEVRCDDDPEWCPWTMVHRAVDGPGRDLAERVKRLEAVAEAAQRWADRSNSDMPEAAAVRKALVELAAKGGAT